MNRIKAFARGINEAGSEYRINVLEQYGNELLELAISFRTEKIVSLLRLYPVLDEMITGEKLNSNE